MQHAEGGIISVADLLVKLYELPDVRTLVGKMRKEGVHVRRAMVYEKHRVLGWVQHNFGGDWASECDTAFSNSPVSCFIATEHSHITGFACHDCTCKNFFGPMGVAEHARSRGIGKALLLSCLDAMSCSGYAYAIIGGVDSTEIYKKAVDAIEIPGSSPGIYRDRLK